LQGEEFSMVLVLPNEKNGLDKLVSEMKYQHLTNMLSTRGTKQVYLALPRFKLSTQMSLVPILKEVRSDLALNLLSVTQCLSQNMKICLQNVIDRMASTFFSSSSSQYTNGGAIM
jgi:serine protease inhibitor